MKGCNWGRKVYWGMDVSGKACNWENWVNWGRGVPGGGVYWGQGCTADKSVSGTRVYYEIDLLRGWVLCTEVKWTEERDVLGRRGR